MVVIANKTKQANKTQMNKNIKIIHHHWNTSYTIQKHP